MIMKVLLALLALLAAAAKGQIKDWKSDLSNSWTQNIKLSAQCNNPDGTSGILLTLHTHQPFNGSIYSRKYPRKPCRTDGDAVSKTTYLNVDKRCGIVNVTVSKSSKESVSAKVKNGIKSYWVSNYDQFKMYYLYIVVNDFTFLEFVIKNG